MPELHATHRPLVVWIVSDGKPGHANQSLGLAEALARAAPVETFTLPALAVWRAGLAWLLKRVRGASLPAPDLVVGAGHATHATLLAAKRAHGALAVVLMRPTLPRSCFDLCILPEHDGVAANGRTLVTAGAVNRVRRGSRDAARGLLLIGGVSSHFDWDSDAIAVQIGSVLARNPNVQWTLTTSRRTPADFVALLPSAPNLSVVPHSETSPDWLPAQLATSATVWVTPDSASMVYEALTAGADVGVFDLPARPASRIAHAMARLAEAQRITRFSSWCADGRLHPNLHPLAEADRCAAWILEWLKKKN